MTKHEIRHIHVALLGHGNDRWRQVEAVPEGEDAYRIITTHDRPEERWEYGPGQTVRCRTTILPDGERVLVATQRLEPREEGH